MRSNDPADRPPIGRFLLLFCGLLVVATGLAWLSQDDGTRVEAAARPWDRAVDASATGAQDLR